MVRIFLGAWIECGIYLLNLLPLFNVFFYFFCSFVCILPTRRKTVALFTAKWFYWNFVIWKEEQHHNLFFGFVEIYYLFENYFDIIWCLEINFQHYISLGVLTPCLRKEDFQMYESRVYWRWYILPNLPIKPPPLLPSVYWLDKIQLSSFVFPLLV